MAQAISWSFEVSSFMVLVNESEEFNYRLMQRSVFECLSAAPVAGLQSYLRSNYALREATGPSYFSPRGCTTAPLRNMHLAQSIRSAKLLKDGFCTVYQIRPMAGKRKGLNWLAVTSIGTWILFVGLLTFASFNGHTTWVGLSACAGLTAWSITVRLTERYGMIPATVRPSRPDQSDAIYILGRRNSSLVIQGSRADIVRWTGQGLEQRDGLLAEILCMFIRIGSLVMLLYILTTIPNGTAWDQISFIVLNTMGQLNVMLGQKLNANACLGELGLLERTKVPTRTHVYAHILRRFGNGKWVEKAMFLPQTGIWERWSEEVTKDIGIDPKELYEKCAEEESRLTMKKDKDTDDQKRGIITATEIEVKEA